MKTKVVDYKHLKHQGQMATDLPSDQSLRLVCRFSNDRH